MKKPTLLYASPFWPKKSGISEYSEALINGLDNNFQLTLVTDDYNIENSKIRSKYNIIKYDSAKSFEGYDYIIYNFGNNPDYHSYMYEMIQRYPGYIILHDYILYYLTVGYYSKKNLLFQKIYEMEGVRGIQIVKDSLKKIESRNLLLHKQIASLLPMNQEIISKAKGIFVHSEYTENILRNRFKEIDIYKINLVKCGMTEVNRNDFLHQYSKINENDYIIGSVGFIAETKQNELICHAVKKYNEKHEKKIHYVMIGEGNYVDHLLDTYIHKTGFLNNGNFFEAIASCDLIMNLRYPYNGESSATLIQCMAMRKPCVVTDIGWFSELPDSCVIKVPINCSCDDLVLILKKARDGSLEYIENNAKRYVEDHCLPERVAGKIFEECTMSNNGSRKI